MGKTFGSLGLAGSLCLFVACSGATTVTPKKLDAGGETAKLDAAAVDAPMDAAITTTLYERLGGAPGIDKLITDFVNNRVLEDPRINGYFLNAKVDGGNVIRCLDLQLAHALGGPQDYPAPGCRDMKTAHAGLGIAQVDFDNLVGHLVTALSIARISAADIATISAVLLPMATDIVEDPANTKTVYQRVGRKNAIIDVINKFVTRVTNDPRINGFFSVDGLPRLKTCLVRQVCAIDGPCKYGQEVTTDPTITGAELGVSATEVCKDMLSVHKGLTSPPGGVNGSVGIVMADFNALVEDLVTTMDTDFGLAKADQDAIVAALAPTCSDIVTGAGCGGMAYGLTTENKLLKFDVAKPSDVGPALALTGQQTNEKLLGLSLRAKNGKLYALGSTSRLYEVNVTTGALTTVGAAPFSTLLKGVAFGFDFDPVTDGVRVVSDSEQNLRLDPDMGTLGAADTALAPVGNVVALAYSNSRLGATQTTLFGIDSATDRLVRIGGADGTPSPNLGAVSDVGQLGVDTSANVGFDIRPPLNVGYAVLEVTAGKSALYSVNMQKGTATKLGDVGGNLVLRALALAP